MKLGPVQGPDITVSDGLKPGELVIVEGIQKVRPGEAVTPTPSVQSTPSDIFIARPRLAFVVSVVMVLAGLIAALLPRDKVRDRIVGAP